TGLPALTELAPHHSHIAFLCSPRALPLPHPLFPYTPLSRSQSRINLAYDRNSPVHSTKGTPLPINGLRLLVSARFQVLFHSPPKSEEHTSELQSRFDLVCRLLLEKKNKKYTDYLRTHERSRS